MGVVSVGIDVGQKVDPTAIAVAESEWRKDEAGKAWDHYLIRHLERLPLGTPYPAVAKRLGEVIAGLRARQSAIAGIFVDATGVGQPVVDLLKVNGLRIRPVYFTHGDRRNEEEDGTIKLGKAWLVSRLQALLQTGRIHLPDTAESRALAKELQEYEIRVDERANDTYGAFRVGTHDDLVTALGLAVQEKGRMPLPIDVICASGSVKIRLP